MLTAGMMFLFGAIAAAIGYIVLRYGFRRKSVDLWPAMFIGACAIFVGLLAVFAIPPSASKAVSDWWNADKIEAERKALTPVCLDAKAKGLTPGSKCRELGIM